MKERKERKIWQLVVGSALILLGLVGIYLPIKVLRNLAAMPNTVTSVHYLGKSVLQADRVTGSTVYLDKESFEVLTHQATQTWLVLLGTARLPGWSEPGNKIGIYLEIENRPTLYFSEIEPPIPYGYKGGVEDIYPLGDGRVEIVWHKTDHGLSGVLMIILGIGLLVSGMLYTQMANANKSASHLIN